MKKLYVYGMLAAGLLASCSNDAPATSDVNNNENDLARVPITLGASSNGIVQREAVESINGKTIGVFALAKDMVAWNWEDNANDGTCILKDIKGTVGEEGKITWTTTATYYYPVMSNHNYSFFGYYPTDLFNEGENKGNVKNIGYESDVLVVNYTNLTGKEDLICGSAVASPIGESSVDGYNATYMREPGAETPSIALKHQLVRLDIKVHAATSNTDESAARFKVTKIELLNAPKSLAMVIAHRSDVNKVGSITYDRSAENIGTYELTGEKNLQYEGTDTPANFGSLMLPDGMLIGEEGSKYFEASITIKTVDGSTEIYEGAASYNKTFKIVPPTSGGSTAFSIGKAYTIHLYVSGPESINAKATLTNWEPAGTDSNIYIE